MAFEDGHRDELLDSAYTSDRFGLDAWIVQFYHQPGARKRSWILFPNF
jgi:hypothetical protein